MLRKQIKTQLVEPIFWLFYNIVFKRDKSNVAVGRGGEGASTTYCNIYVKGLGKADSQYSTRAQLSKLIVVEGGGELERVRNTVND